MAWLMRLEGATEEEWVPTAENARQHFRYLAESAQTKGDTADRENLAASVRLLRMDLSELESLPLPSFCQGCKNVCQECRSQCQSKARSKKKGKGEKKPEDARGATFNTIPTGGS